MADERYDWLDKETAERLLRGEPVEAPDGHARVQVARLQEFLRDAGSPALRSDAGELPGEAAATAAFREARAGRAAAGTGAPDRGRPAPSLSAQDATPTSTPAPTVTPAQAVAPVSGTVGPAEVSMASGTAGAQVPAPAVPVPGGAPAVGGDDLGIVRLVPTARRSARTRLGGPMRFAVVAAVAGLAFGGVAVAATTGLLPSPFGDSPPAATVSAADTPRLLNETPTGGAGTGPPVTRSPRADPSAGGSTGHRPGPGTAPGVVPGVPEDGGHRNRDGNARSKAERKAELHRRLSDACRAHRAGTVDPVWARKLVKAAKGARRVEWFCDKLLGGRPHLHGTHPGSGGPAAGGGAGNKTGNKTGKPTGNKGHSGDAAGHGDGPGNKNLDGPKQPKNPGEADPETKHEPKNRPTSESKPRSEPGGPCAWGESGEEVTTGGMRPAKGEAHSSDKRSEGGASAAWSPTVDRGQAHRDDSREAALLSL
ncbi:hypothetical protein [Streptomyces sp. NPDC020965]|uniref:hypothetical protein n=1 Tax=Streptomyces sp. NPDC020965 TaxID=3365105 RepID=UPI00378D95F6